MSLSSLIVQREVATMRQVEEALARQVIYGGDLVTNLLEVARVDEAVLTLLLAESMRLAPAPSGELPSAPESVRTLIPHAVAVERTVVALEVVAGGKLVLAVAEPLSHDVEAQLRFTLGMSIEQRAAPAVRVHQAVSRAYGVALDRRMQRLVGRLSGVVPAGGSLPPLGAPSKVPPSGRPASAPPVVVGRLVANSPNRSKTESGFPAVSIGQGAPGAQPATASAARPEGPPNPAPSEPRAALLQREISSQGPAVRRRRGPLTAEAARHEAEEAGDRDTLLDLFFDFCRQFFDYSALFLVHGDIAEGRDAFGSGSTRERVLGIGVPLDMPSLLSSVREKRVLLVAKPPPDGLDAVLLGDLHRAKDSEIALVPLIVRTRAVAILIGDCGEAGIDRGSIQQVTAFSGVIGKAFERIIVRRKLDGFIAGAGDRAVGQARSSVVAPKAPSAEAPPPAIDPIAALVRARARISSVPASPKRTLPNRSSVHPSSGLPPPAANVAVVRKISGAPIPREEPTTPGVGRMTIRTSPPKAPSRPPAPAPEPEIVHLEVREIDDAQAAEALFDELGAAGLDDDAPSSPEPPVAIAVPARAPPSPLPRASILPSVMVEDMDRETVAMVDRLVAGELDEQAEGELLRRGEQAMRAIMSRFPGPVTFPRDRIATTPNPPRPSECGPILRLVARERRVALPFVLARLGAADTETRGWATHLLTELPYVEAVPRLVPRLRDADPSICVSAALALSAIARAIPEAAHDVLAELARAADPGERAAALFAMSKVRSAGFVPELVRALGDGDERVVTAAHEGLVQVTRQDFGTDARPWLKWWDANSSKHRIEWLIDALAHDVAEIRQSAGEELRAQTKEYFGYSGDLPPRDRDRVQQRYRDWWAMEGRGRFRRA
jgi:hypothetical protein